MRDKKKLKKTPRFSKSSHKEEESEPRLLELKNPHAVRAALQRRPQQVKELVFVNEPQGLWIRLAEAAEEAKVPVKYREQKQSGPTKGPKQERIGHAWAVVEPLNPVSLDQLLAEPADLAENKEAKPRLFLALDSLQDPHNVGAIFRTASFFGVSGIVVTKNASAPINATVYDIAAGGVESVPFAIESNLNRAVKLARRCGLWNLGTSEHAETSLWDVDTKRPWLILVGNEQKGLKRLLLENCDQVCRIPSQGDVKSLNVSVATGVMLSVLSHPR